MGSDGATPLHGVLGRLELIDHERLSTTDRQRLEEGHQDASTLATLLEGLVALAAAEGGERHDGPSEMTTTAALDRIVARWAPKLATRGQLLVPIADAADQPVRAEWDRVDEIADIFLDNVVRFADSGSVRVEIHVEVDKHLRADPDDFFALHGRSPGERDPVRERGRWGVCRWPPLAQPGVQP